MLDDRSGWRMSDGPRISRMRRNLTDFFSRINPSQSALSAFYPFPRTPRHPKSAATGRMERAW